MYSKPKCWNTDWAFWRRANCKGSVMPRFDVRDSESTWIRGGFLDSSGFVVDSSRFLIIFMQRIMRFIEILTYSTWIPGFWFGIRSGFQLAVYEIPVVTGPHLIDNSNLMQSNSGSTSGRSVRFESAANPQIIPPRKLMRGLNSKQRAMVMFNRHWCKQTVKALKYGTRIKPYKVFLKPSSQYVTQFEKTDLMATRCCFELRAKTRDQPINYQFLDNNTMKNYYPLPTFCSS